MNNKKVSKLDKADKKPSYHEIILQTFFVLNYNMEKHCESNNLMLHKT